MSRKEMITFLTKKNVCASTKDSTVRLSKKVSKCFLAVEQDREDRRRRKVMKRVQRRMNKTGRLSNNLKKLAKEVGMMGRSV